MSIFSPSLLFSNAHYSKYSMNLTNMNVDTKNKKHHDLYKFRITCWILSGERPLTNFSHLSPHSLHFSFLFLCFSSECSRPVRLRGEDTPPALCQQRKETLCRAQEATGSSGPRVHREGENVYLGLK